MLPARVFDRAGAARAPDRGAARQGRLVAAPGGDSLERAAIPPPKKGGPELLYIKFTSKDQMLILDPVFNGKS